MTLQRERSRGHIVERSSDSEEVERCPYSTLANLRWMRFRRRPRARRLVVNQTLNARKVFDSMGIKYSEEEVLSVRVSDRPGSLGRVTRKLAENKINVEYVYGTIEQGASDALVIVSVSNLKKAAQLLK